MSGGGGQELPPLNGGEFLLRLVQQNPHRTSSSPSSLQPQPHGVSLDPAVAAVGPTIPLPVNGHHYPAPPNLLFHNHPPSPWPQQQPPSQSPSFNAAPLLQFNDERSKLLLGKMPFNQDGALSSSHPSFDFDLQVNALPSNSNSSWGFNDKVYKPSEIRHQPGPPPGFTAHPARSRPVNTPTDFRLNQTAFRVYDKDHRQMLPAGLPPSATGSTLHSVSASEIEASFSNAHHLLDQGVGHGRQDFKLKMTDSRDSKAPDNEITELSQHFGESSVVDENDERSDKKKHRDKDFRSDPRGNRTLSQKMRNSKSYIQCRSDIHRFDSRFLDIYETLIPASEEKAKQKQLMSLLEKLVCKEWPNARLYLYGSCANSFGVSKSDIDVCLAIADRDINKSEVLLKLADILQSDNLENVQALTRARVPIVKLKDPVTGISCDICINNVLAVVNTKLLRDYAEIDVRLRQLAFIVKHWAKSRAVNETYQGTLSSYAYVLMCIHFLQQRRPAILPCLQEMDRTYTVTVDDVKCAYFDQVERLQNFGGRNKESFAQLVWAFFNYWAYCHDYANSVISVRTGSFLSKQEKDWTRRIGNERHLICIEDPFETSHDLGRVVDKHSIRVLREEFERAAYILQFDPNPCAELFRPFVPS